MGERAREGGACFQTGFHWNLDLNAEKPAMRNSRDSMFLAEGTAIAKALWQGQAWPKKGLELKLVGV